MLNPVWESGAQGEVDWGKETTHVNDKLIAMDSVADSSRHHIQLGIFYGLSAAVLFGASTPVSKLLLPRISPLMLAALLYLGAAGLLTIFRGLSSAGGHESPEARLRGSDAPRSDQGN